MTSASALLELHGKVKKLILCNSDGSDEFGADRCVNSQVAALFLLLAVVLVNPKLTGNPLTCQVPPEKKEFTKYILTLCYINKSYYWPENKAFDGNTFTYSSRSIKYYPFFAVVFFLCWLILAIPSRCWVVAMSRAEFSPLHLMPILRMAEKKKDFRTAFNVSKSAGITMKKYLHHQFSRMRLQKIHSKLPNSLVPLFDSMNGKYVLSCFFLKKFFFILALVSCILMWNKILGGGFLTLGLDFVRRVYCFDVGCYRPSTLFPHYSSCDFETTMFDYSHKKVTRLSMECFSTRNVFIDLAMTLTWFVLNASIVAVAVDSYLTYARVATLKGQMHIIRSALRVRYFYVSDQFNRRPDCAECDLNLKDGPCDACKAFVAKDTFSDQKIEIFLKRSRITPDMTLLLYIVTKRSLMKWESAFHIVDSLWKSRNSNLTVLTANDAGQPVVNKIAESASETQSSDIDFKGCEYDLLK